MNNDSKKCCVCGEPAVASNNPQDSKFMLSEAEVCSPGCFAIIGGKLCHRCGRPHTRKKSKYCCASCAAKSGIKKRQIYNKKCIICGNNFMAYQERNVYCSEECADTGSKEYYENKKEIKNFDIFQRDDFRCQYCGKTPQDGIKLVVDHIYPVSKGGKSDYHNMITSCEKCNTTKSNKKLPIQQTLRFWTEARGDFSYKEAKEIWEQETLNRINKLKSKPVT